MNSSGSMQWDYTNVYADGHLFATYDAQGLHFQLDDWLGTAGGPFKFSGAPFMRSSIAHEWGRISFRITIGP